MPLRTLAVVYRLAALAGGGYLLALLGTSLLSHDRLLPTATPERLCGLYIDCHRTVSVDTVRYADTVNGRRARGRFAMVTVRLANDARRATLRTGRLAAALRGSGGRTYPRAVAVEQALAAGGTAAGLPDVPLRPGTSTTSTLVFDIPRTEGVLQLRVRDADPFAVLTELFLIGDEDSFLHARSWFVLEPPADLAVAGGVRPLCGVTSGCDTVVRVVRIDREVRAGVPPDRVPADGVFYVVTLAVRDAATKTPRTLPLVAEVRDGLGRTYGRAWDVERLLHDRPEVTGVVRLAFDLPDDVPAPELLLRRTGMLDRLAGPTTRIPLPGRPPS